MDAHATSSPKLKRLLCSPWTMVIVAMLIRSVVMAFTYTDRLDPARGHWSFGWETANVARSIALGHGFSDPYPEPTGPTALVPPLYAYMVAGVFKLFGNYTAASAVVILTINNLFSSLVCLPLVEISRRAFGTRVAIWTGWIWVVFPYSITLSNVCVWETLLTIILLTYAMLATLQLEESSSYSAWAGYGLLWGLTALANPSVLTILPFAGTWIWVRHWRRGEKCTAAAALGALVFLITVAPWIWRCSKVYGHFVAFRSNFGLELIVGNSKDNSSPSDWKVLPGENPEQLRELQRIGEPAYMAEKQREANAIIAGDPLRFMRQNLRRLLFTWTSIWDFPPQLTWIDTGIPNVLTYCFFSALAFVGIGSAIRDRRDYLVPLLIPLIFFPIPYYITHADVRFRHPIDPMVVVFVGYGAVVIADKIRKPAARDAAFKEMEESTVLRRGNAV